MPEIKWGDTVRIRMGASAAMRPGALAEVVGIRTVENAPQARQFGAEVGTRVYVIEFGDGESVELAGVWLEAIEP